MNKNNKNSFIFLFLFFTLIAIFLFYFCKVDSLEKVYSVPNIFTKEECKTIINEFETNYNKCNTYKNSEYFTIDILLKDLAPMVNKFVNDNISAKLLPMFELKYNIPTNFLKINTNELYVIKYYNDPKLYNNSQSQKKYNNKIGYHKDIASYSFSISLNNDFHGGGTHFLSLNKEFNPSTGNGIIFSGKNTHSGIKINSGTRYVIYGSLEQNN